MSQLAVQKIAPAVVTSGGTFVAGLALYLEFTAPLIGILTAVSGLVLSVVLSYGKIKKGRIERQILYMERDILAEKESERLARAADRKKSGQPCRREEDETYCPSTQTGDDSDPNA